MSFLSRLMGPKSGESSPQVYYGEEVNLLFALLVPDGSKVVYTQVVQMLDTSDGQSQTISFLSSEADAALMFTSMAMFERCPTTRSGYIRSARSHYDAVLRLAGHVLLNAEGGEALNGKLAGIKAKLDALGERL